MKRSKLRSRWVRMLSRCEDDDNIDYKNYGGRGIYVCSEWHDFNKFYEWCIQNGVDDGLQLDRVDNDGPYSPDNCQFIDRSANMRNRRNTFFIDAFGETKTATEWTMDDRCSVSYPTLQRRIALGWNPEIAVSKPSGHRVARPHNEKMFTAFGESKTLRQWSKDDRCVVSHGTLSDRVLRAKWNVEVALTRPTGPQHGR